MFRRYDSFLIESKNVERAASGLVVLAFAGGAAIGAILGGFICDKLKDRMQIIPIIMGVSTAIGAAPMIALVNLPPQGLVFYMILSFPSGIIIGITGSAIKVVLMNVTKPETRGAAFSAFNLFDDVGKSLGSAIVVILILSSGNRQQGLTYGMFGWIVGGFIHLYMSRTIVPDYEASQEELRSLKNKQASV